MNTSKVSTRTKLDKPTVPAENFLATLAANVENTRLSAEDFRDFVRNTLPIVIYPQPARPESDDASNAPT